MSFIAGNIFLFFMLLLLWGYVWHTILNRMNFSGWQKRVLLVCLVLPYTSAIGLIYLAFFPWPSEMDAETEAKQIAREVTDVSAQR
jgi:uncharacterized RDD family membrane protein YckC